MQKLQFEAAWDKTISTQDRLLIEQAFQKTKEQDQPISCDVIRKAINHKKQILITTLIHNRTEQQLTFNNRKISIITEKGQITRNFTIDALSIPPYCSMPWTFIFDESNDFLFTEIKQLVIEI
ncbi:SLAP domain-containing protein [Solibacillus sp. FSL W7-1324]|uniref:SLAP domain-containing protein n=1 Tax=Solibacillus sp. FSL W7-1324 TaxID=2921701 RepID=UPI0030F8AFA7